MKKVLWVSNHPITEEQREEAATAFAPGRLPVIELSMDAKKLWGQIDPEAELSDIEDLFWKVLDLSGVSIIDDLAGLVIMGELSACLAAIKIAVAFNIPVATPTTRRESSETILPDGSIKKIAVFKHVKLRFLHDPSNEESFE